jgi:3-deoxy-manno-octulosonate cytidylyltransferase (CMP-KDO synthetase)
VVVATDDPRIADHASALGLEVALTAKDLDSGSARAFAAAQARPRPPTLVINLQGDAPFIPSGTVVELITTLREGAADVATPVYRLDWQHLDRLRTHKVSAPFSGTTCLRRPDGQALWFSKTILPAMRDEATLRADQFSPVWQHLGLYGYRMAALEWFVTTPPSLYERLEGLEQLRFLEHGWTISTIEVARPEHALSGIDTAADLALAEAAIAHLGDPYAD